MTGQPNTVRVAAYAGLLIVPALAWWVARDFPAWVVMWALAGAMFFALKLLTLTAAELRAVPFVRILAYIALWPGMDVRAFLRERPERPPVARPSELAIALLKLAGGVAAGVWAAQHVGTAQPMLVGWVGMIGIIFTLHFGLLHVVSWLWRRAGVDAPPIMRAPIVADSLGDFWGGRWNAAFADAARRFLFKPTVRTLGVLGAGVLVFLVSGLVHEVAVSLPARGGWGGPTLYFLIQGAGIAVEKSALGKRLGLGSGIRGWFWTALCTLSPVTLLFHAPFVHNVIVPFFEFLAGIAP
jgi:Membrane bound O-acyl transferase family